MPQLSHPLHWADSQGCANTGQGLEMSAEKACGHTPLAPVCALVLLLLAHAAELAQQAGQGALLPPQDLQHAGRDHVSNAIHLVWA